jgi:ABC-type branched-subunit amino acid transport system substrate-binding protein
MRGKKLGRLLVGLTAVALAVGVTAPAAVAGGVHTGRTPTDVPGFDGNTIKLGAITPESGLAATVGRPLTNGNRVYWQSKNAEGGVGGKYPVELTIEDSRYQVEAALQGYDKIKGDVVAFQQILGTQIVKSVLTRLKQERGFGGPATLDSLWVREANLMPIAAPYQVEVANVLDWYKRNGGQGKKLCAMAQDDEYGSAGLDGARQASKTLKLKVEKTVRFATTSDVSAQVGELADAGCEGVLLVALPNDTASIITKMVGRNFSPQVLGLGPTWLTGFENDPNNGQFLQQNFIWVGEGPGWGDMSVPGMAKMIQDVQQYAPDQRPDQYFAFGYAQAWAMDQILERAVRNGDLSKAGITKASNQVGTLKFDGLVGDYKYGKAAKDRNPPRASTIAKVQTGVPVGLQPLETNMTSDAAKKIRFRGGGG